MNKDIQLAPNVLAIWDSYHRGWRLHRWRPRTDSRRSYIQPDGTLDDPHYYKDREALETALALFNLRQED